MADARYRCLFSDVGGVLGTNGWDGHLRRKTIEHFGCEHGDIDARHRLMFDSYERGFLTLDEYLERVFFAADRPFNKAELKEFVLNESTPWPDSLALLHRVKKRNDLRVGLISNEGEGITQHRVKKFGLHGVADFMIFSCFVHMRKPDPAIWRLALDLAQADAGECIYVDDRQVFVDVANDLGFTALHHTSVAATSEKLRSIGLEV